MKILYKFSLLILLFSSCKKEEKISKQGRWICTEYIRDMQDQKTIFTKNYEINGGVLIFDSLEINKSENPTLQSIESNDIKAFNEKEKTYLQLRRQYKDYFFMQIKNDEHLQTIYNQALMMNKYWVHNLYDEKDIFQVKIDDKNRIDGWQKYIGYKICRSDNCSKVNTLIYLKNNENILEPFFYTYEVKSKTILLQSQDTLAPKGFQLYFLK